MTAPTSSAATSTATREKTISWEDPHATALAGMQLSGLDFIRQIVSGAIPAPPIARLMGFDLGVVREGEVEFTGTPDESVYNPIGVVHGGYVCTMLDSALGCAVHTTLPAGTTYTSIEIKVNYLRPVRGGMEVVAVGRVTKPGRRVAFAEGEIRDGDGKVLATAHSSFLVMPVPS